MPRETYVVERRPCNVRRFRAAKNKGLERPQLEKTARRDIISASAVRIIESKKPSHAPQKPPDAHTACRRRGRVLSRAWPELAIGPRARSWRRIILIASLASLLPSR